MRKRTLRSAFLPALLLFFWALLTTFSPHAAGQYSEEPAAEEPEQAEPRERVPIRQGGPRRSVGETVVVPRKRPTRPPREPLEKERGADPADGFFLRADVQLVNLSVVVQNKKGLFIPNLQKGHFQVLEDGVEQKVERMEAAEAPMTVAMVIEFSDLYWQFLWQTMQAAYGFVNSLREEDWVAVIAYDMRPEILQDFTQNKAGAFQALSRMRIPGFSETNLFDALSDTITRMDDIDGKKAILLISSGVDTFSKMRYDKTLKLVESSDTPIYAIGTGQALRMMYDARGYMGSSTNIGFLQADNALRSFARLSGGKSYFPRFEGQFPEIYNDIAASLRNEYNLSYTPTNNKRDGKFRKIKVELVAPDGQRLKVVDEKGKEIKYEIRVRKGYYAPRAVD